MSDHTELLTSGGVAAFLGISRPTVYRWTEAGDLPEPVEVRGRRYWSRTHLVGWLVDRAEAEQGSAA